MLPAGSVPGRVTQSVWGQGWDLVVFGGLEPRDLVLELNETGERTSERRHALQKLGAAVQRHSKGYSIAYLKVLVRVCMWQSSSRSVGARIQS